MSYCQDCKHFRERKASWLGDCVLHNRSTDPLGEFPCFARSLGNEITVSFTFDDDAFERLRQAILEFAHLHGIDSPPQEDDYASPSKR